MYSLFGYGKMVADQGRMAAYEAALRATVWPGAIALDIGTGTGIHALIAARCGAGRVYGVDVDGVVAIAQTLIAANGYSEIIHLQQGDVTQLTFPAKMDVMVSDLRGVLPLFGRHIPTVIHCREQLLAKGGAMIPQQDRLWATLVHLPETYATHYATPWQSQPHGFDFAAAQPYITHHWRKALIPPEACLVEPGQWATLDYRTIASPHVQGDLTWQMEQESLCHGLGLWFDTTLWEDIGFSNRPGETPLVYGQGFFPWPQPVMLEKGDRLTVHLQANLVNGEYIWQWQTVIEQQSQTLTFKQSTFQGQPLNPATFTTRRSDYAPGLSPRGKMAQLVFADLERGETLGAIAGHLQSQFADQFPSQSAAIAWAADLITTYG
ncbi:MAG: methyltransferase domain-containing protein [Spirulina sp. DLM2.Bin59]|nr:MAG: methyltransferase domain-containing protein [Spirulina sp. DLM2.Bin59]